MSCYEEGFRISDAVSVCSVKSKAMIDSLFEDRVSISSSNYSGWYATANTDNNYHAQQNGDDQNKANSAVQSRIEAMFASIQAETGKPGETAAAILTVAYLGSAPVGGRVASVRGLQEPLRQLLEHMNNSQPAELEVSRRGLTIRLQDTSEKINPFRRIAVWSAVRLHSRSITPTSSPATTNHQPNVHHAFLPLVGDETTTESQEKYQDLYRTMRGLPQNVNKFPPIFAVIMRRPGAARLLECHAFACKTSDDAVAAAATLYKALLTDLETNNRHPRQKNGLGCVSLASVASSYMDNSSIISKITPSRCPTSHPVRPPRSKKHSTSSSTTTTDGDSCRSIIIKTPRRHQKSVQVKPPRKISDNKNESKPPRHKFEESNSIRSMSENSLSTKKNQRNKFEDDSSGKLRKKNEELNNLKNKFYSSSVDYKKPEKTDDDIYLRTLNCYEQTPRKINKSFDVERNYSFVEKNGSIVGECVVNPTELQLFDKNHGIYEINKNNSSINSCKSDVLSLQKRNCNSSHEITAKQDREKLYEQHFRDADKIMSIESDDENEIACKKINNSNKNKTNNVNKKKASCNSEELKRISRADEFELQKKERGLDAGDVPRRGWRGEKKRSRAGSEPPLSKTENAVKLANEIKLKRSQSDLEMERGDLMTRVELPRRSSFLKSSGSNTRLPNSLNGGTPLGFTELFDEFRNQEGLTSVDDILATIIDPEGMSFNDLKPLYKEFLLKLASTLTQDELYQRSASIMKKRRRPQRRKSSRKSSFIGRAIKRSVSKFKNGPTEFTSVMIPARKFNESLDSSSSGDVRHKNRVLASRLSRRRSSWRRNKGLTTSEDSDTCKRNSRNNVTGANRSSSGYVSCSECSYDSESCTCISADKCYCSLSRRSPIQAEQVKGIVCACDTDSCSESNKCYCVRKPQQGPTILEQLRQRGIVPCDGTLSRAGSPERTRINRSGKSQTSSRSLEYKKMHPSARRSSTDNLGLDYELFNPGKKIGNLSGGEKVLVVSARDQQGRLVYVGGTERHKKSMKKGIINNGGHHEALSIKKSAEIAAVFGPTSTRNCRRTGSISSLKSSISLEAGLGYLP